MSGEEILIWRDKSTDQVMLRQGEKMQSFTPVQWRFICQCVDKDLSNRLDDALRLVSIMKENATGSV